MDQIQKLQTPVRVLLGDTHDQPQVGFDKLRLSSLHFFFGHIEMLDRVLNFFGRNQRLFRLKLANPALGCLIVLLDVLQHLFREAGPPFDRQKILVCPAQPPQELRTGFTADAQPALTARDFTFCLAKQQIEVPNPLRHPVFQHTVQIDRLHLVDDLPAHRIDLFAQFLLLLRIGAHMAGLVVQVFQRGRDLTDRIERIQRFDPQLFVVLLDGFFFKVFFRLDHRHDLPHIDLAVLQLIPQIEHELQSHREAVDDRGDIFLALFDPLGNLDFALAAQQRNASHLFQVEPDGIVGSAEGPMCQIDLFFIFLGRLGFFAFLDGLFAFSGLRGAFGLSRLHNLNVHFPEHRHDRAELVR